MVVSFQNMDGRNDKNNNRYGLINFKHNNSNDGLIIHKKGSDNKEEEEEEVDHPHQRRSVDKVNNRDPGENLDMPDRFWKQFGSDIESKRKSRRSHRE